jgi:hypothetical protein
VRRIEASLAAGGYTIARDSVAGRQTSIGRRRSPVLRGHAFVIVGVFKSDASRDHLDRFLEEAAQYARTVKGGLRSGVRAVAVAVVGSADGAGDWAENRHGPVEVRALPVLVDLAGRRVAYPDDVDGAEGLRRLVDAHIAPSLGSR